MKQEELGKGEDDLKNANIEGDNEKKNEIS